MDRALEIHIEGVVQGVGFRPFVYNLARQHGILGWVRNTSAGVDIHAEGLPASLRAFVSALTEQAPPLARIHHLTSRPGSFERHTSFSILDSAPVANAFQPISPDIAICPDCLRELRDPADRRYRYPFINCTTCGPRFTLIRDIPYDRPYTTMAAFPLCDDCAAEYHNPEDRRFHAQPVACPACGPQLWLEVGSRVLRGDDGLRAAARLLREGKIVAIKGLGGFHLACDATGPAVAELRRRKGRVDKPFALMMADLETIRRHCDVSDDEMRLLTSTAAPIVLLRRRSDAEGEMISDEVAPGQATLGVMLPYTPLHVLLLDEGLPPLVMTSGNHSDEPIVTDNDAARESLADLADAVLMHDRDIFVRTDDSVIRVFEGADLPVRRSRGYAPYPVQLPFETPPLLAVGGELKNTFCVTRDTYAFMSHHIGDMDSYETLASFESGVAHFERLFRIRPQAIAYDLHPDYRATRYAIARAEKEGMSAVGVQHHHAHIASCMAEHGLTGERPVIGVCFDGTGYGTDGTIWGGEFLIADYAGFEREACLKPIPLPGGDAATRKPARFALSMLLASGCALESDLPPVAALSETERTTLLRQLERGLNAPLTSSMGRLFDAVASLIDLRQNVTYEGQAAIELEALVDARETSAYAFALDDAGVIDAAPVIQTILDDWRAGVASGTIAARFHQGVARLICDVCVELSNRSGLREIALSGGVFQNVTLLERTLPLLRAEGLTIYTHRLVPPNDGGLALGQAMIAGARLRQ